jgi:hypothetical protein
MKNLSLKFLLFFILFIFPVYNLFRYLEVHRLLAIDPLQLTENKIGYILWFVSFPLAVVLTAYSLATLLFKFLKWKKHVDCEPKNNKIAAVENFRIFSWVGLLVIFLIIIVVFGFLPLLFISVSCMFSDVRGALFC